MDPFPQYSFENFKDSHHHHHHHTGDVGADASVPSSYSRRRLITPATLMGINSAPSPMPSTHYEDPTAAARATTLLNNNNNNKSNSGEWSVLNNAQLTYGDPVAIRMWKDHIRREMDAVDYMQKESLKQGISSMGGTTGKKHVQPREADEDITPVVASFRQRQGDSSSIGRASTTSYAADTVSSRQRAKLAHHHHHHHNNKGEITGAVAAWVDDTRRGRRVDVYEGGSRSSSPPPQQTLMQVVSTSREAAAAAATGLDRRPHVELTHLSHRVEALHEEEKKDDRTPLPSSPSVLISHVNHTNNNNSSSAVMANNNNSGGGSNGGRLQRFLYSTPPDDAYDSPHPASAVPFHSLVVPPQNLQQKHNNNNTPRPCAHDSATSIFNSDDVVLTVGAVLQELKREELGDVNAVVDFVSVANEVRATSLRRDASSMGRRYDIVDDNHHAFREGEDATPASSSPPYTSRINNGGQAEGGSPLPREQTRMMMKKASTTVVDAFTSPLSSHIAPSSPQQHHPVTTATATATMLAELQVCCPCCFHMFPAMDHRIHRLS